MDEFPKLLTILGDILRLNSRYKSEFQVAFTAAVTKQILSHLERVATPHQFPVIKELVSDDQYFQLIAGGTPMLRFPVPSGKIFLVNVIDDAKEVVQKRFDANGGPSDGAESLGTVVRWFHWQTGIAESQIREQLLELGANLEDERRLAETKSEDRKSECRWNDADRKRRKTGLITKKIRELDSQDSCDELLRLLHKQWPGEMKAMGLPDPQDTRAPAETGETVLISPSEWKPPPGYVGANEIMYNEKFRKRGKLPPRPTIQYWEKRSYKTNDPVVVATAPDTGETYYPEEWVLAQIEQWNPRTQHTSKP